MKILFIGHYGGRNIGDEIILLSQMQLFEKYYEKKVTFLIYTYDESFTKELYSSYGFDVELVKAFGLRHLFSSIRSQFQKIRNVNFAIIGGGGLIQDVYFSYGIFRYLLPAFIALERRIPVYTFSLGVYRFNYSVNKKMFKQFLELSEGISVRDSVSIKNCNEIKPDKFIFQIPDSALLFDETQLNILYKESKLFNYTVILRDFFIPYLDIIVEKSISYFDSNLIKEIAINIIVFENNSVEKDLAFQLKNKFKKQFNSCLITIHDTIDPINYLNQLNKSDLVLSGRLHGIIPSVILEKRVICLSYSPKIESFCSERNYKFIKIEDLKSENTFTDFINDVSGKIDRNSDKEKINSFIRHIEATKNNLSNGDLNKKINFIVFFIYGAYLLLVHVFNKVFNKRQNQE